MDEIKIYKSPSKALKLILLGSPFVAAGLYGLLGTQSNMPPSLAWAAVCFFGIAILYGLFNLLDRRPQIIINTEGIFDRMAYRDFINWSLIKGAYVFHIGKQTFIGITIDPAALAFVKKKGAIRISKHLDFKEITLSLGTIKIDEQRFRDFIVAMANAEPVKRTKLIDQYNS